MCVCYSGNRIDGASVARFQELQSEVSELTDAEDKLDELINKCSLQLRLLTEDSENKIYPSCLRVCVCVLYIMRQLAPSCVYCSAVILHLISCHT